MAIILDGKAYASVVKEKTKAEVERLGLTPGLAVVIVGDDGASRIYVNNKKKHQHFFSFPYQAGSWEAEEMCHCKVESTGIGLNIRYIISNFEGETAREIYTEFYVKRGDASENRIKEVKNMCFSDRLSNHLFLANFFRLFLSYLAYEMFRLIKLAIAKTSFKQAKTWQIDTIRTYLLKIGATIKITKRRIYYRLSKAFVFQDLFKALVFT